MKHVTIVSKALPATAQIDHPGIVDSIKGFIDDPLGVIQMHICKDTVDP